MTEGTAVRGTLKRYILSPSYRYDLLISPDAGPRYGEDMGWPLLPLGALGASVAGVAVVDSRLTPGELAELGGVIGASPSRLFVLTIVDPFHQQNEDGPWRQFMLDQVSAPNVVFLSKYHATEFTAQLQERAGADRLIALHYPYVASREVQAPSGRRRRKVIFAGAINRAIYPERALLYDALQHKPWLRLLVRHLTHPGYPDVGDPVVHEHIGDRFVRLLAQYRLMFVSGSRCNLEFLKYRECGYAGSVPVGHAPASFPQELRDCILPLDLSNPGPQLWRYLRLPAGELDQRAARFAQLQRQLRNPAALNAQLDDFLRPHLARLAA